MALHDITNKILDDAKKQVTAIVRASVQDAETIMQDAQKLQKLQERQSDDQMQNVIHSRERTAMSRARREAQKIISTKKRALIDGIVVDARAQIVNADTEGYAIFLTHMIEEVATDIRGKITEVRAPSSRIDETRSICAQSGIAGNVTVDTSIDAGMVLVSADADYDLTLARKVSDRTQDLEVRIAQTLFGT